MESFWPMIRPSDLTFIFHGDITSSTRERERCISGMKGARGRRDG